MSSEAEDFLAPPYLSSGAVAVITVISVLLTIILAGAAYYLFTSWKLKNNLQRQKSVGFEEVSEEEDGPRVDRLREDTVVVHDLVFHDDSLYSVNPAEKPNASPAPSIFQENALLQEILSSVAEMSKSEEPPSTPVPGIIDDVIETIVVHSSQVAAQTEEEEGRMLVRNQSYHRAIEEGMFQECKEFNPCLMSEEFNTFMSEFSGSNCATLGASDPLEMSEFSSRCKEKNASVSSLVASIEGGESEETPGKYHSTPILDGPQCGVVMSVSQSRSELSTDVEDCSEELQSLP